MTFVTGLVQRISSFEQVAKYHAERLMEELRLDRIEREGNMASCERFLNSTHVTKLIEERDQMMDSMDHQSFSTKATVFPNMKTFEGC